MTTLQDLEAPRLFPDEARPRASVERMRRHRLALGGEIAAVWPHPNGR
jgi:hypothetical protein